MPVTGLSVAGALGSAITGAAHHLVGGVLGIGLGAVFTAAGQWVASGAVWLLGELGGAMSATTTVDLSAGWFSAHESTMTTLAAAVLLPMILCATIQALYRQSASMLGRSFLVHLPLALLFTGVAVELVQMALAITDTLSAQLLSSSGTGTTTILAPVSDFLAGSTAQAPGVPAFVVFVGGLLVAVACLVLWLELVIRAAAVSVAVLFLPLALAALVWPAVSHWCRRLAETLAALVLSKLVIAATLSLAAGALAGGLGIGGAGHDGGGFAAVITGIALLAVATFSPFTLLELIPAVEAGAISQLESTRHRLSAAAHAPLRARNMAMEIAREAGSGSVGAVAGAAGALVGAAGSVGTAGAAGAVGSASSAISLVSGTLPAKPKTHEDGARDAGDDGSRSRALSLTDTAQSEARSAEATDSPGSPSTVSPSTNSHSFESHSTDGGTRPPTGRQGSGG
jgi:hypothetical protein